MHLNPLLLEVGHFPFRQPFIVQRSLHNARTGHKPVGPMTASGFEHLRPMPIDLALAGRDELLRVPGIGPVAADSIMNARKSTRLVEISQLRKLGIHAPEQATPYILLDGRRPASQPKLF